MRVLVACECSGVVRQAFRARGHDAYSCDLVPAEDDSPFHIQADALDTGRAGLSGRPWDLMIAHPPCDHLAASGARYFAAKRADGRQAAAVAFVRALAALPIARWAIENPISILGHVWREPDQIIEPWMFGHGERKATCLWLQGLPLLMPTRKVGGRVARVATMPDRKSRAREGARTPQGIGDAMAAQWGGFSDLVEQMLGAETPAAPTPPRCPFCGFLMDMDDVYGCPNCLGEGLDVAPRVAYG